MKRKPNFARKVNLRGDMFLRNASTIFGATSGAISKVAITRAQAVVLGVQPGAARGDGTFWCSWNTATFAGRDLFGLCDIVYFDRHVKWCCERGGNIYAVPERWETVRLQDRGIFDRGLVPGSDISYGLNTSEFFSHDKVTIESCFWGSCPFSDQIESWVTVTAWATGAYGSENLG